jgi:hypothetical protein
VRPHVSLSAFVVAPVTSALCWAVWHTVHLLLVAAARPRVWFTRIVTLTTKSAALACRYPQAARKAGHLTIDRIRDPPTARELKRHADRSSTRSSSKRVFLRRSTRRHSTASSTNRFPNVTSGGCVGFDFCLDSFAIKAHYSIIEPLPLGDLNSISTS